jgi:hypothetical protein
MTKLPVFSLSLLALAISPSLMAEDNPSHFDRLGPSQADFGGVGLLQMPTARMAREGEFSANYMDDEEYRRWSISVQAFEWLETTIRYTDVRTRLYSQYPGFSGDQTYKDKGIDLKLQLWQESYWLPQMAVGVRDIAGTGLFDSEFLVASKRWGNVDFTLGMGWGNMAESGNIQNPFCTVSDGWCERESGYSGRGGKFEYKNLFHGPAALFGGIEYQTPWQPLRLKLEYDGNDYSNEFAGKIEQSSPINVGAVYRLFDELDTHLSYQRGNTLMWGFTLRTNLNDLVPTWNDAPPVELAAKPTTQPLDESAADTLAQQLASNAGFQNAQLQLDAEHKSAILRGEQTRYRDHAAAEQRATTLVVNALPHDSIDRLHVVYQRENMAVQQSQIDVVSWEKNQSGPVLGQPEAKTTKPLSLQPESSAPTIAMAKTSPLELGWKPQLQQSWGGAESFYLYQFGINGDADLRLAEHLKLGGTLYWNWFDNFDKFNYTAPPQDSGAIPRVRTWVREYVSSSDLLLNNLQLTAMDELAPDWYGQAYGGYLEMMFAGVGSEVLYRPYGQRWALGADINYVRQRDWDNTLKLADYTTTTGHMTAYFAVPGLKETEAKISVGRYLAQDVGATVDLSKRFTSGVVVGAFATITDVSADEYGEGSFTKGLYFTIPFDLLLSQPTTRTGSIAWIPLTRDGGQMVGRRYSLYTLTEQKP